MITVRFWSCAFTITVLGLGFCATAPAVTFSDTFNPPSPLWSNTLGDWTASNSQYFAQMPSNNPPTYSGLPYDLADLSVDVDVNSLGDGGIWLHADPNRANAVLLVTGGDNYGQGGRGGNAGTALYWHVVQNGSFSGPMNEVDGVFTPGQNYHLRVTVTGAAYAVYVHGGATAATTLTTAAIPHGRVGLYDDQPNVGAGGFGPPQTFSNFQLQGTLAVTPGDMNCDGVVNFSDINPFVRALSDPAGYAQAYPGCNILNGDLNGDGSVGFDDINPFVALLGGG